MQTEPYRKLIRSGQCMSDLKQRRDRGGPHRKDSQEVERILCGLDASGCPRDYSDVGCWFETDEPGGFEVMKIKSLGSESGYLYVLFYTKPHPTDARLEGLVAVLLCESLTQAVLTEASLRKLDNGD